jgi:late competence protein required for DNA uptake (superfamily II DNA/RNA helicase)
MDGKITTRNKELSARGRRCRKCKTHGKVSFLRNHHKITCNFKDCTCKRCVVVARTREQSRLKLKKKRQTMKDKKVLHLGEITGKIEMCLVNEIG